MALSDEIDRIFRVCSEADNGANHGAEVDAALLSFRDISEEFLSALESGELRTASPPADGGGDWVVNEYVKKGILLYFRAHKCFALGENHFDKIPLMKHAQITSSNVRLCPGSIVRRGSFLGDNVICMPSFVNIGAYVGAGSMIDTWATVGSCAQIGSNCHISGGAGIGGVFEPVSRNPVIIEDDVFIGARSEIAEGVIVRRGAILSMGVYISGSTKIFDRATGDVSYGEVPEDAVVVSGSIPCSGHSTYAAIIVKYADEKSRSKTEREEILRVAVAS